MIEVSELRRVNVDVRHHRDVHFSVTVRLQLTCATDEASIVGALPAADARRGVTVKGKSVNWGCAISSPAHAVCGTLSRMAA